MPASTCRATVAAIVTGRSPAAASRTPSSAPSALAPQSPSMVRSDKVVWQHGDRRTQARGGGSPLGPPSRPRLACGHHLAGAPGPQVEEVDHVRALGDHQGAQASRAATRRRPGAAGQHDGRQRRRAADDDDFDHSAGDSPIPQGGEVASQALVCLLTRIGLRPRRRTPPPRPRPWRPAGPRGGWLLAYPVAVPTSDPSAAARPPVRVTACPR